MASAPECITKTFKLTNRLAAAVNVYESRRDRRIALDVDGAADEAKYARRREDDAARYGMDLLAQQTRRARAKGKK
jgi:hypothetical protein